MSMKVLVTGSAGLIGTTLKSHFASAGIQVVGLDLRETGAFRGDVRDCERVGAAIGGCDGVVHLAAVSRVVWAERDPELCHAVNIGGLRNVLDAATRSVRRPWIVFASSREVYGEPSALPVVEDCPLDPMSVYARSKVEGERLVGLVRDLGLHTAIVRFSSVYGSTEDHADRVVPAFVQAALSNQDLRVDGAGHSFDFCHVDDAARGVLDVVRLLQAGASALPPIHFVSGKGTSLKELADMAVALSASKSGLRYAPPRDFDVTTFVGSPDRARAVLNWSAEIDLRNGLTRLIRDFRNLRSARPAGVLASGR